MAKKAGATWNQDPVPGKCWDRFGDDRHDRPGQVAVDGGLERRLDDGPLGQRAFRVSEAGSLLHFERPRALQEPLIARKDWPPCARGGRIGDRRATLAAARTVGIDHGGGFDLRGQKLFGDPLSLALALLLFLPAAFF